MCGICGEVQSDCIHDVPGSISDQQQKAEFKQYTHERLDAMGVPPEGMGRDNQHFKAGCRIGSRLDWVEARLKAYEALCKLRH